MVGALAITLALLLAGVALVVREDAREAGVASASPADVPARIAIERPGFAGVVLAREGEDWRVVAPCALDAEETRVEPLLAALAGGGTGYAADEVDLRAAGLEEPWADVRLDGERISLGGTDLGGERRYARRGERVTLVPEWTLSLVSGGLSAFASLAPFDAPPTRLVRREPPAHVSTSASTPDSTSTSASVSAPAPAAAVDSRSGSGSGLAGEPDRGPAIAIDPSFWSSLTADQVAPWPVPDAPPALERARLEATFADGATGTLDVVRTARWSALRLDGADCAYLFGSEALPAELYR